MLIPGANNQYYVAVASGEYTVETTNENGCVSSSSISNYTVSTNDLGYKYLHIYPNPTRYYVQIEMETLTSLNNFNLKILDVAGKTHYRLYHSKIGHHFNEIISIEDLPAGVYSIQIQSDELNMNRKLVIVK